MKHLFIGAAAALLLTACNSGLGNKKAETTPAPITTPTVVNPLPRVDSGAPATQGAASGTAVALNPAHGQPGHRCDIPEGAPLNSAPIQGAMLPGNNNAAAAPVPAAPAQSIPLPSTTSTARLNPAHGQPGHRCDIAVGAPLN